MGGGDIDPSLVCVYCNYYVLLLKTFMSMVTLFREILGHDNCILPTKSRAMRKRKAIGAGGL